VGLLRLSFAIDVTRFEGDGVLLVWAFKMADMACPLLWACRIPVPLGSDFGLSFARAAEERRSVRPVRTCPPPSMAVMSLEL
jgi:hypothetical protein